MVDNERRKKKKQNSPSVIEGGGGGPVEKKKGSKGLARGSIRSCRRGGVREPTRFNMGKRLSDGRG